MARRFALGARYAPHPEAARAGAPTVYPSAYPALRAWEMEAPFSLIRADAKDNRDTGSPGTELTFTGPLAFTLLSVDGHGRVPWPSAAPEHDRRTGVPAAGVDLAVGVGSAGAGGVPDRLGVEFGGDNPQRVQGLSTTIVR